MLEMKIGKISLVSLCIIELLTLVGLVVPFVLQHNLYSGDMPGHYFAAWYEQNFLFPRPFGWNPFFFAGYPQNQFYPPLFHYLSAIMGLFFGTALGFKLLISASILLAPVSFQYFAAKFGFNDANCALVVFFMWLLLFIPDGLLGANYASTFNTGVVVHMFALPLLFFYFGKANESLKTGKYVAISVLLSVIILSHVFIGIISVIVFLSFLIAHNKKNDLFLMFKHGALSFLLISFWAVPLLSKIGYSSSSPSPGFSLLIFVVLLSCAVFLVLRYLLTETPGERKPILYAYCILVALVSIGYYLQTHFPEIGYAAYFTRLLMPIVLLMPALAVTVFLSRPSLLKVLLSIPPIFCLSILLTLSFLPIFYSVFHIDLLEDYAIKPEGIKNMQLDFEKLDGRILDISYIDKVSGVYYVNMMVPMNTGNQMMQGLFVESSKQARYVYQTILELNPHTMFMNVYPLNETSPENHAKLLPYQLRTFNINYLITSEGINRSNMITDPQGIHVYNYSRNYYGDGATLGDYVFGIKEKSMWDVFRLLNSTDNSSSIVALYSQEDGNGALEEMNASSNSTGVNFYLGNETATVYLSSNFRNWEASVNGKLTLFYPSYSAAYPPIMYFKGNGTVELRYTGNPFDSLNATFLHDVPVGFRNETFSLYKVGDSKLAEVLDYAPSAVCKNWDDATWDWFNSENISKVIVQSCEPLPSYAGFGDEKLDIVEVSRTGEYMKFIVHSDKPVPVYVKVSDYPNWRAYVNGVPAKIYLASPYMMLVYGNGTIEFRYEPVLSEYAGGIMSCLGILWVILSYVTLRKKKKSNTPA